MEFDLFKRFAAVVRLASHLSDADNEMTDDELSVILGFLNQINNVDETLMSDIIKYGYNQLDDDDAVKLIYSLDDGSKQIVSNLFARVICKDNKLTVKESQLYDKYCELCKLPNPQPEEVIDEGQGEIIIEEEETPRTNITIDEDKEITPLFLLVKYNGRTSLHPIESTGWNDLGPQIASLIGADRLEVVRYTKPLNELSKALQLNERHLVFITDRNGGLKDNTGDNMPATMLYGAGYPIYGHVVFALETDNGYTIEGIRTISLAKEVFAAIYHATDGLLTIEE
jgi:hypothetical protein